MRFKAAPKKKNMWRPWFALYPVKIDDQWVWLEWVERWHKFMGIYTEVDHRFPKKTQSSD